MTEHAVFLGCKIHISDRLYIMVMYIGFYVFFKILNFSSKSERVSIQFYRKMPVYGKN
jgi:hypothetical protein